MSAIRLRIIGARSLPTAVCECVRMTSSLACAAARGCAASVSRAGSLQRIMSTSLRGWRSQDRGGSSPPFRTKPQFVRFCASGRPQALERRRDAPRSSGTSPPSAPPLESTTCSDLRPPEMRPCCNDRTGYSTKSPSGARWFSSAHVAETFAWRVRSRGVLSLEQPFAARDESDEPRAK